MGGRERGWEGEREGGREGERIMYVSSQQSIGAVGTKRGQLYLITEMMHSKGEHEEYFADWKYS